jgi:hypothetical protein
LLRILDCLHVLLKPMNKAGRRGGWIVKPGLSITIPPLSVTEAATFLFSVTYFGHMVSTCNGV